MEYTILILLLPLLSFLTLGIGGKWMTHRTAATSVMYDADLKIWVEGYVAFSKGRYQGATGEYTIWEKGAYDYWNVAGPKQKGGQA